VKVKVFCTNMQNFFPEPDPGF